MTEKKDNHNSAKYIVKELKKSYQTGFTLSIPELVIHQGEILGIEGENGSGKSTLLKILSLLESPDSGIIIIDGVKVGKDKVPLLREQISILPQNPYLLKRTVFEQVAFPLKKSKKMKKIPKLKKVRTSIKESVYRALKEVGLSPLKYTKRKWYELSGGEAQRVALASRLITNPSTIILDEPTTGCDKESIVRIKNTISRLWEKQRPTIIIASHDVYWLRSICRRLIRLHDGKIITSEMENIIPGPWEMTGEGILKRVLSDGQSIYAARSEPFDNTMKAIIKPTDIVLSTKKINNISAQNILKGHVTSLYRNNYDDTIRVNIQISELSLTSFITTRAIDQLKIYPGMEVYAIFKATAFEWV